MRKARYPYIYAALSLALLIGLIGLPLVVKSRYLIHIFIMTCMYSALALGYDLVVGHLGFLSLAHPTFFGVGGYVAAILSTQFGTTFLVDLVLAGIAAAGLAFLVSFPFFRLEQSSFAIGTLGFALIMQLVANNEVWLTDGPRCVCRVPHARLTLPALLDWQISSVLGHYYLILGIMFVVVALCSRLTTSRVGRTLRSIREDEILALASGVNLLKYKRFAFVISALIAGSVGAYYVHYSTLICPTELSTYMTTGLLIILFLGGVGSMRGVIVGAIIFSFLPEMLRITPKFRMLIYGALLLVTIVYMPDGVYAGLTRWFSKLPLGSTGASSGQNKERQEGISNSGK